MREGNRKENDIEKRANRGEVTETHRQTERQTNKQTEILPSSPTHTQIHTQHRANPFSSFSEIIH